MVGVERVHDPDPAHAETYRHLQATFRETLDRVEPTWERLAELRELPADDGDDLG
jgi:hypothetical protein